MNRLELQPKVRQQYLLVHTKHVGSEKSVTTECHDIDPNAESFPAFMREVAKFDISVDEIFTYQFDESQVQEIKDQFARQAHDLNLNFSWFNAACCASFLRKKFKID